MGKVILDCETRGTKPFKFIQNHPDFEVLFNGWKKYNKHCQDLTTGVHKDALIVGHNVKYEYKCLTKQGFNLKTNKFYCTQIAEHLLDERLPSYSLESLASKYKSWKFPYYKNLVDFEGTDYWLPEFRKELLLYNKFDLDLTELIELEQKPKLIAQGKMPLMIMLGDYIKALGKMEMRGVKIDQLELAKQGMIAQGNETVALAMLNAHAEIDWNSNPQIGKFFKSLDIKLPRTKKGNKSVAKKTLHKIDHPAAKALIDYRTAYKYGHTYVAGVRDMMINGMYYLDYSISRNQDSAGKEKGTKTGRLSEKLGQVMPRKDTNPFKRCIISKFDGGELLEIDWAQQEVRLIAERSGDQNLIKELNAGFDLHAETLHRFPCLKIRVKAKNAVFNVFFGGGVWVLVNEYGMTEAESRSFQCDLRGRYPGVFEYHNEIEWLLENGQPIKTLDGRERHFPTRTEGINFPIQGTASSFNKIMLIMLDAALLDYQSQVCMDIHDSLIVDIHPEEKEEVIPIIQYAYENFKLGWSAYFKYEFIMDYPVELKIGKNLYDMEKV